MLDIKYIRKHPDEIIQNCQNRHLQIDIQKLLELDEQSRLLKNELDAMRQRRNEISQQMKSPISQEERQPLIAEAKQLREQVSEKEKKYDIVDASRQDLLSQVPNLTHPDSPIGQTDEDNLSLREVGAIPEFDFEAKDHLTLMEDLDLIDFEGGAKVAGQKFYYLKNEAVMLEFALIQYALKVVLEEGFTPFITPDLARMEILDGIGFNPRGEETQIYSINDSDLCLIATSEITLGGRLSNKVFQAEELPVFHAGVSHCFRTEAGAAGRESKGLYRVHQFSKVEMFIFTHPDQSEAMHEKIREIEEKIYQELNIPYRVVDICTGDLGSPAYRKYDLEAWMPGRGKWGEVTSTSNCTDYQSRRLNIRFKDSETGKNRFVHMLNGTAVAVSRTLIALIENGQQSDGSIRLPKCLGMPDIVRK
ncbi:MAG: serine--tRNA ligase [SAR324 cluster bacterium]|nr:serine--tRNA ligase [SAR324 cluster bacterium]